MSQLLVVTSENDIHTDAIVKELCQSNIEPIRRYWIEILTGMPMVKAMVELITDLANQN